MRYKLLLNWGKLCNFYKARCSSWSHMINSKLKIRKAPKDFPQEKKTIFVWVDCSSVCVWTGCSELQVFLSPAGPTSCLSWLERTEWAPGGRAERGFNSALHFNIQSIYILLFPFFCPGHQRTSLCPGIEQHCWLMTVLIKPSHYLSQCYM